MPCVRSKKPGRGPQMPRQLCFVFFYGTLTAWAVLSIRAHESRTRQRWGTVVWLGTMDTSLPQMNVQLIVSFHHQYYGDRHVVVVI